jgi:hypothetical protein
MHEFTTCGRLVLFRKLDLIKDYLDSISSAISAEEREKVHRMRTLIDSFYQSLLNHTELQPNELPGEASLFPPELIDDNSFF